MTLLYSISSDRENQCEEASDFLSTRWSDVLDQDPVLELCSKLSSASWSGHSFEVQDVTVADKVRVRFTFIARGLGRDSRTTGDEIDGSALAIIDEYDRVSFAEIELR